MAPKKRDYWRCNTRLYSIWSNMKDRCTRKNNHYYPRYGGRGITVCKEWMDNFYAFEEWAYSNGYREYLTIDRIDNDKGYSPDNCRWSTQSEQMWNTSKSVFLTINGERRNICEWAEISGVDTRAIRERIRRGDTDDAIIRPLHEKVRTAPPPTYEINGISKTAQEWADEIGVTRGAFTSRWRAGKRGNDLLKPNRNHNPRKYRKK